MALSWINTGTASATTGSKTVTGQGTTWLAQVRAGYAFGRHVGRPIRIASVDSDTQLTLAYDWPGPDQATAPYEIEVIGDPPLYQETTRKLFDLLSTGAFFEFDASGTLAERSQFDGKPRGFAYLDTSTDQIYYKASDTSGDWAGPYAYAKGDKGDTGPAPDLTFAPIVTGDAGTDASLDVTGAGPYQLGFTIPRGSKGYAGWAIEPEIVVDGQRNVIKVADFIGGEGQKPSGAGLYVGATGLVADIAQAVSIRGATGPQGPAGVNWQGAWDAATAYAVDDVVTANDANGDPAAWIAIAANTNASPPTSPADWSLFPGSFPTSLDYGLVTAQVDASRDYGALA